MDPRYYDITPLVVRKGETATVTIRSKHPHTGFAAPKEFTRIVCFRQGDPVVTGWVKWMGNESNVEFKRVDERTVTFDYTFNEEDEYSIRLIWENPEEPNPPRSVIADFHIYALEDDLFELTPYRGDFHIHSFCSDGKESPEYVAAACRREGCDFMALTDHGKYQPSLQAIESAGSLGLDIACFPGEEVHCPDNPVHVINFGSSFSVNDYYRADDKRYREEVEEYRKTLPDDIDDLSAFQIASSEWAYDKIREGGGIAMFCHPYWRPEDKFHIGETVHSMMFERRKFDVFEVFGGYYREQLEANMLQLARYQECRANGKDFPVAGVSDAHGCDRDLFGWYYTIVFAKNREFSSIADSIRDFRSVAVQDIPGSFPIAAGHFRLVKYTYFLLREYFPIHNRFCREEGELAISCLAGDISKEEAVERLAKMKGRTENLFDRYRA